MARATGAGLPRAATASLYGFDAYSPEQVAHRIEAVGVAKARMALVPLVMLGILAGAFIGLGTMLSLIVRADVTLGLAASRFLAGAVFSLGLLLVVVAGAELFTGNNLLVLAWADGQVTTAEVLRNWIVVCIANFAGAAALAAAVHFSGHGEMGGGAIARTAVELADAKQQLPWLQAFLRGVLCNVLVCMAVWMAMAGRSVADKAVAVIFPVTAFVAAGFEHSIANMYLLPFAMLAQAGAGPVTIGGAAANLALVIAGNLAGGSVLVGLAYHVIYRRPGTVGTRRAVRSRDDAVARSSH